MKDVLNSTPAFIE